MGGLIEKESNLSQRGYSWICYNAEVYEDGQVKDDALISEYSHVRGKAIIYENALISGNASIIGEAVIHGNAVVCDNAVVYGSADISGRVIISGNVRISGHTRIAGDAVINKTTQVLNINNLKYNLTIVPGFVFGGCRTFTHEEFRELTLDKCKDPTWTDLQLSIYKSFLGTWEAIQAANF